jgi:hypothetical protein
MILAHELIKQLQALPQSAEVQFLVDGEYVPMEGEACFDNTNDCIILTAE